MRNSLQKACDRRMPMCVGNGRGNVEEGRKEH